jgi:Undecaprenyl-phosphate glucose phosphotransferase
MTMRTPSNPIPYWGHKIFQFPSFHGWNRQIDVAATHRHSSLDMRARLPGLLRVADMISIIVLGLIFCWAGPGQEESIPLVNWFEIILGAILGVIYTDIGRAYNFNSLKNTKTQFYKITITWGGAFLSLLVIEFIGADEAGMLQSWLIAWFLTAWSALILLRIGTRLVIERWHQQGRLAIRVAIVGDGIPAFNYARRLYDVDSDNLNIVGVFVERSCPLQRSGSIDDLCRLAMTDGLDEIVIILPWNSHSEFYAAVRKLSVFPVNIKLYTDTPRFAIRGLKVQEGLLTLQSRPLIGWGGLLKRAEDVMVATVLLCLLAPVFLLIGLAIKLDSRGPVFFRQERFGFNNNNISVFKFRSMYHDPLPNPLVPQAQRNDPRVTRVGAFLRQTSLDELPQLFNVLYGNMSLVGPRPHATAHNRKYSRLIDGYLGRHRMKPGITGWAQVNGYRGETDTVEKMRLRVDHDLFYINNWSFFLDLKIVAMTVPELLRRRNAY